MLESYTPDLNVVMSRNPYYYHYDSDQVQLPYLDKYVVLIVASQDVALLKFQNGELDCFAPRPGDIPILLGDQEAKRYAVMVDREKPVFGTTWFTFNWDTQDPKYRALFRDLRFREAVAHAIDKETMIQNLFNGLAVPQWSPVSYLSPFYAGRESYAGPVTETGRRGLRVQPVDHAGSPGFDRDRRPQRRRHARVRGRNARRDRALHERREQHA